MRYAKSIETLFKDSGRFLHRNRALGRDTTHAEQAFREGFRRR
jgi:uncharacterized protein (DUF924 family)